MNNLEWKEFFEEYKELKSNDQAAILGCSSSLIRKRKRQLGLNMSRSEMMQDYKSPQKADSYPKIGPEIWDNRDWFYEHYVVKGLGKRTIARIIDRSKEIVFRRLERYGIPDAHHEHKVTNPCCDEEWLVRHYCRRRDYLKWCEENGRDPLPDGGMGLPIYPCAEIAGVSRYTIYNWLSKFGIYIRANTEAVSLAFYYKYCDAESDVESRTPQDPKISG